MGWFTRRKADAPPPRESALDVICRLLVESPLDWESVEPNDSDPANPPYILRHKSGVHVMWLARADVNEEVSRVWYGGPGWVTAEWWEERMIRKALRGHWAARARGPLTDFGESARALARAVLAGDLVAERSAGGTP